MATYSRAQNLADAKGLAGHAAHAARRAEAHGRAHPRRRLRRRRRSRACCDIVIAAVEATFSLSEAKLGLIPSTISPYVINAIGARQASRYFLTGGALRGRRGVSASASLHDIVPIAQLDDRVNETAGAAARRGPARAARVQGAHPRGRASPDRRQARRRHGAPDRRRARVAGGQGGRGGVPRASAAPAWVPAELAQGAMTRRARAVRHLAARGARRRGRLGERPAAVRGAVHRRRASATCGVVDLPAGLDVLAHPLVLAASGFMCCVEFFADKIPGVDSAWDVVQTFIRIPAGAALAASVFGDSSTRMDARRRDPGRHARGRQPSREVGRPRADQHVAGAVLELGGVVRRGARGRHRAVARVRASDRGARRDRARSSRS